MPYRFTGKEFDEETKLYYFGARYYDPRTSVWQSPDPILGQYLNGKPSSGVFEPRNMALNSYAHQKPVNLKDIDGKWAGVDDAVFSIGGGLLGMAGRGVVDLIQWKMSSREDYAGAFVGGAVAGETLLYTANPVLAGAAGNLSGNLTTQGLKMSGVMRPNGSLNPSDWTATQANFDYVSPVVDTTTGALGGKFLQGIKMQGLNAGRNNYNSLFKQMHTKFQKGMAHNIRLSVAAKMFAGASHQTAFLPGAATSSGASDIYSSFTAGSQDADDSITLDGTYVGKYNCYPAGQPIPRYEIPTEVWASPHND